ncbi:PREDICTED: uncharacterized protein LOC105360464 [Ceratosolen solmsi marchali]|uniref:Uncharacterized protein LOC105360464 n=1 Tax=Ceratosolen solmsi marchali TaxID=326594 RepID=A0AAJ6VP44_9HYME|nr:PREDICTED: uncharacterized protein LOC105360464 [Ceratosolen solmsi marchali]
MALVILKMFLVLVIINAEVNNSNKSIEQPLRKNENLTEVFKISFSNESVVSEMQYAICSIRTEDVFAKAQSTASRILTGVCTSEEMTKTFKNLEKIFLEKLDQVQQTLIAFIQSKYQPNIPKKIVKNSRLSAFKTVDYLFNKKIFTNYT